MAWTVATYSVGVVLDLFPVTARVDGGELSLGGVPVSALAAEHGTPLLVYCEETLRAQARAYRTAAPDALIAYGTKAFANVEVLRVLAGEGIGADVSTLGELAFARRAGIPGDRLLFHGNNKSDEELRAAAEAEAAVVIDAPDEPERAAAAGVRRVLVRLTPGVEAVTHQAIATAHDESKFGLAHDDALAAIDVARGLGLQVAGIHFHVGSQLAQIDESLVAVDRLAAFCEQARSELGWTPSVIDLGGGLGVRHNRDEHPPEVDAWVHFLARQRFGIRLRFADLLCNGVRIIGEVDPRIVRCFRLRHFLFATRHAVTSPALQVPGSVAPAAEKTHHRSRARGWMPRSHC